MIDVQRLSFLNLTDYFISSVISSDHVLATRSGWKSLDKFQQIWCIFIYKNQYNRKYKRMKQPARAVDQCKFSSDLRYENFCSWWGCDYSGHLICARVWQNAAFFKFQHFYCDDWNRQKLNSSQSTALQHCIFLKHRIVGCLQQFSYQKTIAQLLPTQRSRLVFRGKTINWSGILSNIVVNYLLFRSFYYTNAQRHYGSRIIQFRFKKHEFTNNLCPNRFNLWL